MIVIIMTTGKEIISIRENGNGNVDWRNYIDRNLNSLIEKKHPPTHTPKQRKQRAQIKAISTQV